ncbi:immune inhibitor A domain-containing protein [Terracoccus luteus]|uniref:Immune inhibitor A n=1 Tax=Terracoccus luteus TaxID=53356 RepID=A0A839PMR2_9MICO|nr:immune inhibitor A domain-containing protein [Terracoccus luteus]MBB2985588.1 immune inhibitor A [Terracoccus luteus]MCP2171240.1 immune inhibitor A [Terracoccus luteus]
MRDSLRSTRGRLLALVAGGALVAGAGLAAPASAVEAVDGAAGSALGSAGGSPASRGTEHDLRPPQAVKQDALRQKALQDRLEGKPSAQGKVARVGGADATARGAQGNGAKGQYVQLEREGTDKIFVVIVEFGDEQYPDPRFQGPPPDGSTTDVTGPLHNEIPKPDRTVDNSTLWLKDYSRAHYEDMYFNRMAGYYERQSSGRYSVEGAVTDWVKVPFNEALYGRNYCGGIVCATSRALVRDALAVWVQNRLDAGQTMAEITAYLKTFDQQDRYDIDGDGNFDEPDGVIDHFQIVHAGGDEAAGDPNQGTDAIWSHRSAANLQAGGPLGAGVDVGTNGGLVTSPLVPNNSTGVWVYDYTVQPENGGLGVFAHEYGHDLGLPDLYDTSGNTGGAENNTAFWTLMSSGANIGDGSRNGIGDAPTDMGAFELYQLGWLQPQGRKGPFYDVARAGERSMHRLGSNVPAARGAKNQALFTLLPDKQVPLELGEPYAGERMYWSTQGDEIETTMTHAATAGTVTAQVNVDIEPDWDYAYLESSPDGQAWSTVPTNLSTNGDPNGQNEGNGITGTTEGAWVQLSGTLPAGTTQMRFRYWTDVAATYPGIKIDQVALDGTVVGTAETDTEGWTFDGFVTTTGDEVQEFFNAYIAENRQYDGYDTSLRTAYNFGFQDTAPDRVETYPYQNGMLVNYWDGSQTDNNVGDHPGSGLVLPVDAHPAFSHWPDGTLMRNRILSYDSTFGMEPTQAITLHNNGMTGRIASKRAIPEFDDTKTWWYDSDQHGATGSHPGRYQPGWYSVDPPKTGTTIRVVSSAGKGAVLTVRVQPKG